MAGQSAMMSRQEVCAKIKSVEKNMGSKGCGSGKMSVESMKTTNKK